MPSVKVPYPPSPTYLPEGLTDYAKSHVRQQNKLLAGLFVFLIFYIAMVVFFAMLGTWCVLTFARWPIVKVVGVVTCLTFFLFLVKGFFKGRPIDKEKNIEITAEEQPELFKFIDKLCEEVGAPLPERVFVSADVNAACVRRLSLINLFVEPRQELLIGLGLVNCMNLSEFKGVLAHEFGHFCQSGQVNSYSMVVQGIIWDMVKGEDWFDRLISWMRTTPRRLAASNNIGVVIWLFAVVIGSALDLGRKILGWLLNLFALQGMALSREREFHADRVAVSAVGSDNATHMLLRVGFGMRCFMQALEELAPLARDHKLCSNDLYLHHSHAAELVRRKKKDASLGLPPAASAAGPNVRVFDAEQEEAEDEDRTPPMWRSHPPDADREENIKRLFVPAPVDHRSAWILFSNPAELKERMTYKFYRSAFGMKKNTELTDARTVQEYIDNERAETTYDARYHGAYDERIIEPGELSELNALIHNSPWPDDRMLKVYDKLYEGCRQHAEEHIDGFKELQSLRGNVIGKPSKKMKRMIKEKEEQLEKNREWFKSFDRRVYLLHVQMAAAVDEQLKDELVERYRFQLEVQRLYQLARENLNEADMYLSAFAAASRGEIHVPNDFPAQVIAVLRTAWKTLKKIIQDARDINLPAMKNFEEGERLADFILDGKLVAEPPLSYVKGAWIQKLMDQLMRVKNRCLRLHFKSLGGVLALQEKIAAAWLATHRPESAPEAAAEVVAAEVVAAEVISAEVVEEVVAVEVVPLQEASLEASRGEAASALPHRAEASCVQMAALAPPAPGPAATLPPEPETLPSDRLSATLTDAHPEPARSAVETVPPAEAAAQCIPAEAPITPAPPLAIQDHEAAATTAAAVPTTHEPAMPKPKPEPLPLDDDEPLPRTTSKAARRSAFPQKAPQPLPVDEVLSLDDQPQEILPLDDEPQGMLPLDDEPAAHDAPVNELPILTAEVLEAEIFPVEDEVEPYPMAPAKPAGPAPNRESPFEQKPKPAAQRPVEPPMPILSAEVIEALEEPPPSLGSVLVAEVVALPAPAPAPSPSKSGFGVVPLPKAKSKKATWGSAAPTPGEAQPAPTEPARECMPRPRPVRPFVQITMVKPGQKSPFAKQ